MDSNVRHNVSLDKFGILFSFLCILHCLSFPVISLIAPSLTLYLEQEWIHLLLLGLLFPIAFISLVKGKSFHLKSKPLIVGCVGMLFLALAILLEDFDAIDFETYFTLIGSVLLSIGHLMNLKYKNLKIIENI